MYAILETGGKQYRVAEGDVLYIEKLNHVQGDTVVFDRVLAVSKDDSLTFGNPVVAGATISGTVLEQGRGKKVIIYKYKKKKDYRKKQGHRQPFTKVQIDKISL
jgi:large subunit ribosomal protein L21